MQLRKLTQVDVANLAGVSQPAVQKWLKGVVPGSIELYRLCQALDENMADFFGEPSHSSAIQRLRTTPPPPLDHLLERAFAELDELKQKAGHLEDALKAMRVPHPVGGEFEAGQKRILQKAFAKTPENIESKPR